MRRFIDWFEDYYNYVVMVVCIAFLALGGVASFCSKDEPSESAWEWRKERDEHRAQFYAKYKDAFPQFSDERDFSIWLDNAEWESIVLLHSLIESKSDEYAGDDGFADMVDYLKI